MEFIYICIYLAEEMLGDLHAINKGLNNNHPAHLHHASHNPTQQLRMSHTTDKETHVDLPAKTHA